MVVCLDSHVYPVGIFFIWVLCFWPAYVRSSESVRGISIIVQSSVKVRWNFIYLLPSKIIMQQLHLQLAQIWSILCMYLRATCIRPQLRKTLRQAQGASGRCLLVRDSYSSLCITSSSLTGSKTARLTASLFRSFEGVWKKIRNFSFSGS